MSMSKWRVKDWFSMIGDSEVDEDRVPVCQSEKPPVEFETEEEAIEFIMAHGNWLSCHARAVDISVKYELVDPIEKLPNIIPPKLPNILQDPREIFTDKTT